MILYVESTVALNLLLVYIAINYIFMTQFVCIYTSLLNELLSIIIILLYTVEL